MAQFLDDKKIHYLGFAALDNIGRVFEYEGEILRGIYPDKIDYVNELFSSGLIEALTYSGEFIETVKTDYKSKEFPLILKHRRLTSSMPTGWTLSMLKDAAKTILHVNEICNNFGYELSDAHPYNVCFSGVQSVWVDFGSIQKRNSDTWGARSELINSIVVPLILLARDELLSGYSLLLAERTFKICFKPFRESHLYKHFLEYVAEGGKPFSEECVTDTWLDSISSTYGEKSSYWGAYQNEDEDMIRDMKEYEGNRFQRFFKLPALVKKYANDAKTAIDLAGNLGLASFILSSRVPFTKIINTDYDPLAIEKSYTFLRKHPDINVETYVLNFMLPMQQETIKNYRCDVAFALAVTHHLLLSQNFKIDGIFEKIKQYSNKYVFIEFMPLGLWGGDPKNKPNIPDWYTMDWFKEHFEKYFELLAIETLEQHEINGKMEPHRVLFIGKYE